MEEEEEEDDDDGAGAGRSPELGQLVLDVGGARGDF